MRLKLPILDVYAPIQVTLQTDKVVDIPCGTKASPSRDMYISLQNFSILCLSQVRYIPHDS